MRSTNPPASRVGFQSTRPRGARRVKSLMGIGGYKVSIHAPARGATRRRRSSTDTRSCFNPRARAGRDGFTNATGIVILLFQSTRPRGARREIDGHRQSSLSVSIHAPARGATRIRWRLRSRPGCFNPRARAGRDVVRLGGSNLRSGFNPRARAGRDFCGMNSSASPVVFQSTRPRGARHHNEHGDDITGTFQSTRPRGARQNFIEDFLRHIGFQSTRPRGARQDLVSFLFAPLGFQSTRPRGARPDALHYFAEPGDVSIHAPARGATALLLALSDGSHVSIHAPARGATSISISAALIAPMFQSTRPRGARRSTNGQQRVTEKVSIHAPARGATPGRVRCLLHVARFNPRARAGRDAHSPCVWRSSCLFQSTRPRGARLAVAGALDICRLVSIHAPARGATRLAGICTSMPKRFNPRARAGRDLKPLRAYSWTFRFNPRARAGRDQGANDIASRHVGFNPRARAGRDSTNTG